jgi:hypothetical protein
MKTFLIIFSLNGAVSGAVGSEATMAIGPIDKWSVCYEYAQQVIHGPGAFFARCVEIPNVPVEAAPK